MSSSFDFIHFLVSGLVFHMEIHVSSRKRKVSLVMNHVNWIPIGLYFYYSCRLPLLLLKLLRENSNLILSFIHMQLWCHSIRPYCLLQHDCWSSIHFACDIWILWICLSESYYEFMQWMHFYFLLSFDNKIMHHVSVWLTPSFASRFFTFWVYVCKECFSFLLLVVCTSSSSHEKTFQSLASKIVCTAKTIENIHTERKKEEKKHDCSWRPEEIHK